MRYAGAAGRIRLQQAKSAAGTMQLEVGQRFNRAMIKAVRGRATGSPADNRQQRTICKLPDR